MKADVSRPDIHKLLASARDKLVVDDAAEGAGEVALSFPVATALHLGAIGARTRLRSDEPYAG